ncbi:MAG TPA: phosphodiester glycosidase family protein [bacterium]|nr:phosphodiester glycosidase family protein [bacterium]HOL34989.1 phosphodiester glycosidase family protein [bacterium]
MIKKFFVFVFLFVAIGFCGEFSHLEGLGIEYSYHYLSQPRPVRIHVLKINLTKNQVIPTVIAAKDPDGSGPAEAALTDPFKLVEGRNDIIAFVNTNPWDSFPDEKGERNRHWYEGQLVDIMGLVATGGKIISPAGDGCTSVWSDISGKINISKLPDYKTLVEGVAGWYQIVKDETIIPKQSNQLNPLTGIGTDSTGYILWLVVADGRQKGFSEGMSHWELADFMLKIGCNNVALMDGGGSTIMAIRNEKGCWQVVNSPSDRVLFIKKIRPVPVILGVRKK